jgi:hypothetical protein
MRRVETIGWSNPKHGTFMKPSKKGQWGNDPTKHILRGRLLDPRHGLCHLDAESDRLHLGEGPIGPDGRIDRAAQKALEDEGNEHLRAGSVRRIRRGECCDEVLLLHGCGVVEVATEDRDDNEADQVGH